MAAMWTIWSHSQTLKAHSSRELLTLPRQEPSQFPSCLSVYCVCFMLYWQEVLHFAVVVILFSSIIFFSHGLFINSQLWGRNREVLSVTVLSQGALTRVWCRSCAPFQECCPSQHAQTPCFWQKDRLTICCNHLPATVLKNNWNQNATKCQHFLFTMDYNWRPRSQPLWLLGKACAQPVLECSHNPPASQRQARLTYWWHHCSTCFIHKSPFHLPAVSLLLVFLVLRCSLWVIWWQASVAVLPSACYGFFFSRSKHSSLSGKLLCGDLIFFYNFYFILIPRHV